MLNYSDPNITVDQPAPGHYVIKGFPAHTTMIPGEGNLVPSSECYVSPGVPTEALLAILQDRGDIADIQSEKSMDALAVIRKEIPEDLSADSPEDIAAAFRMLSDENEKLRDDGETLTVEARGKKAIEKLAGKMYDAYCEAVGGKAFNGDPLPAWKEFRADDAKEKQSNAWVVAAQAAVGDSK